MFAKLRRAGLFCCFAVAAALAASGVRAQNAAPTAAPAPAAGDSGNSGLFGDLGGLRPLIGKYGVTLTLQEQSEILGNISGGRRQGFDYDGLTTGTLQFDTQNANLWPGGLFNVSGLQIHGRNLTADNLLALQSASGIEAERATRLWELWYQQKLLGDKLDIKLGEQSLDQEFMISTNGAYFINTAFGWPMTPTFDMPGGGPAYPLSALGARLRARPADQLTLLAGIFNGSPVANNSGDPQMRNPSGLSFPLNGGALAIGELQWATPGGAAAADPHQAQPLGGVYKIGLWWDSERFADLRFDGSGLSLANPASSGIAATHRGDYGFYAVADQMIYRWSDDPGRNINLFLKPTIAPQQDRNLIAFSLNAGAAIHGLVAGRNDDVFGLGVSFVQLGAGATGLDRDKALFNPGVFSPARHNETCLEATYQFQATAWLQIQPDLQYIANPGGGIVNPDAPTQRVKNEAIVGVRANVTF